MRIIAGSARGRQIEALPGLATRPTLDRVKEAMFGALQFDLPGSHVLDLFSGSGNLGLEAASRGAKLVVCNGDSAACAALIRKNAAAVRLSDVVTVMQLDYREAIRRLAASGLRFDFAFLDAPYASGFAEDAARTLFAEGLMQPDGLVLIEHSSTAAPPQDVRGIMRRRRTKKFGACAVSEMERDETI